MLPLWASPTFARLSLKGKSISTLRFKQRSLVDFALFKAHYFGKLSVIKEDRQPWKLSTSGL